MTNAKKYIYTGISLFLAVIFVFMTVYSLWFGAKNAEDIITITDSFTVADDKVGTGVYHHSFLKDKEDVKEYHWLTDDSIVARFAGYVSKFISPLYLWVIINLLSVALMIYMLYNLISRWERGALRYVLVALFPFLPVFFRCSVQLGAYTLAGALLLGTVYTGAMKEASVIKWYFNMTLCAIVASFLPEFVIIVYIIPFVAYRDIKSNYNSGKAASHILLLLIMAIVIHFMFLGAFSDYDQLYSALIKRAEPTFISGFKNFFCLDTKEKIGIYLPVNIMAAISLLGLFNTEKYVKKYIYPGLFLYLWAMIFAGNNAYILGTVYPVVFLSFSQTLIHSRFFRRRKMAVSVVLCVLLCVCIPCCGNISYKNHIRGMKVAYFAEEYSPLYEKYVGDRETVLAVDDEMNLVFHMYAAYPQKTILSVADDDICPKIIGTYYPQCIVSRYELNYAEYEKVYSDEEKFIYKLIR